MRGELLDIQPEELKFIFELKKQTSCTVELYNKSNHYVAFKVKTTSPKKYSVKPNIGIIEPKSARDFIVTMQAQRAAPPDMMCKDKFLVQSAVVPVGTTEEEITSSMFSRDDDRYVEERKLRVILASPPLSPVCSPVNGVEKAYPSHDNSMQKDQAPHVIENDSNQPKLSKDVHSGKALGLETVKDMQEQKMRDSYVIKNEMQIGVPDLKLENHDPLVNGKSMDLESRQTMEEQKLRNFSTGCSVSVDPRFKSRVTEDVESKVENNDRLVAMKTFDRQGVEDAEESKLVKEIDAMKLKICELELSLDQAEVTISKLSEERLLNIREKESLQQELAWLRTSREARKVQVGFPLLFVCMVALVSVILGYFLHR